MTEFRCMFPDDYHKCEPEECNPDLECPIHNLMNERKELGFVLFQLIEEVPEYFAEHTKLETRTGVDSWEVWRFSEWFNKLKSTVKSDTKRIP